MYRFYLCDDTTINHKDDTHDTPIKLTHTITSSPKISVSKETVMTPPSPHTMRRNISKENFIKYQWAWTL